MLTLLFWDWDEPVSKVTGDRSSLEKLINLFNEPASSHFWQLVEHGQVIRQCHQIGPECLPVGGRHAVSPQNRVTKDQLQVLAKGWRVTIKPPPAGQVVLVAFPAPAVLKLCRISRSRHPSTYGKPLYNVEFFQSSEELNHAPDCDETTFPYGAQLRRQGFDETTYDRESGHYRVRCSQCEALVINGQACHERGCPNQKRG